MPSAAKILDTTNQGGTIVGPGVSNVLIGGLPAAVMGDICTPPPGTTIPPSPIILGSTTVLIGGKPAARSGLDMTASGAASAVGEPTVQIG
ncbi:MAG: PAAR domain-containing protein [Flavobacteriales bacterium]|nr:PAAR domain-containing protein [Flavobacteriales bacterium]